MATDDEILVVATLRDELSRPARRVREAIDDIEDEARQAGESLDDMERSLDKTGETAKDTANDLGKVERATERVGESTKETVYHQERSNRAMSNMRRSMKRFSSETRGHGRQVLSFWGNYFTVLNAFRKLMSTDMSLAVPQILTGIASLGGGAVMILGSLGRAITGLLPLIAGLPGVAYGFVLAGKSLDFIKKNIPGAEKAFKRLGNAINVVDAEAFGREWGPAIRDLSNALAKSLEDDEIGRALGKSFASTTRDFQAVIESGAWKRFTTAMETTIPRGMAGFGKGLAGVTQGMLDLVSAMGPVFEDMGNRFGEWGQKWAKNIESKVKDGSLTEYFERAYEASRKWGSMLGNLFGGLRNVFGVGAEYGGQFVDSWSEALAVWREFTGSEEGQAQLHKFFSDMVPNLQAIGNLFGAIWDALHDIGSSPFFAKLTNDLADQFIPLISQFFNTLDEGGGTAALDRIGQAVAKIAGNPAAVQAIIDVLSGVASVVEFAVDAFLKLPGPIQTAISYMLGLRLMGINLFGPLRSLGTLIGNLLKPKGVPLASTPLGKFGGFISKTIWPLLSRFFGFAGGGIITLATTIGRIGIAFLAALGPVGWIILAVVGLIALFVLLWNKSEGFRNFWIGLGQTIAGFWNGTIYPLIMSVVQWVQSAWATVSGAVMTAWTAVATVVTGVWNWISGVISAAMAFIGSIVQAGVNAIMWIWGIIGPGVMAVWNFIVAIIRLVWTIISAVVGIGIALILAWFRFLGAVAIGIWNYIKAGASALWSAVVTGVMWFVGIVVARFNQIRNLAAMVWAAIQAAIAAFVGFAIARFNQFRSNVQAAFTFIKGVAQPAIDAIKSAIESIRTILEPVMSAVKSAFSSAFNSVKGVVMPIINTIKSAISSISGMIDNITGGINNVSDRIGSIAGGAINTISNWFAEGGSVSAGMTAGVGELGPEAFVTNTGQVKMLGMNGPEVGTFGSSGYVVPAHVTAGMSDEGVPSSVLQALRAAQSAPYEMASVGAPGKAESAAEGDVGAFSPNVRIEIGRVESGVDIERAVYAAITKVEKNRKERR